MEFIQNSGFSNTIAQGVRERSREWDIFRGAIEDTSTQSEILSAQKTVFFLNGRESCWTHQQP